MTKNILTLNVLNFNFTKQELTCYITDQQTPETVKLAERDAVILKKQLNLSVETNALHTTFDTPCANGYRVTMKTVSSFTEISESSWSYSFLKSYFTYKLTNYFRGKGYPVSSNLISDIDVWIPTTAVLKECNSYKVFRLRVQFCTLSVNPELIVSYKGVRSVIKHSLNSDYCCEIAPDLFNKVLFGTEFFRYVDIPDYARRDMDRMFPCLNKELQRTLLIPFLKPDKSNRYIRFRDETETFRNLYLQPEMLSDFMLVDDFWLKKEAKTLPNNNHELDLLTFGNGGMHREPKVGMKEYGPKAYPSDISTTMFFICHKDDVNMAQTIYNYMKGELPGFVGLNKYTGLTYHTVKKFSIYFDNKDNPLPEIIAQLNERTFSNTVRFVAIYLSPYSKWEINLKHKTLYYELKEELLHRGIVSQVLEVDKNWIGRKKDSRGAAQLKEGFHFFLPNIAVALVAKLGGTPWSLASGKKRELVIGISAFKSDNQKNKYLGSAFCFSGEGRFYGFDCFRSTQINELTGSILMSVKQYLMEYNKPERLVIHFYKTLSRAELIPVEKGLAELGLDIPVVVVSINKTYSEDIIGFDTAHEHLMPFSYTYFPVNQSQYLLYNNTLQTDTTFNEREGYPFPLKISVQFFEVGSIRSQKPEVSLITDLFSQVCRFSQLYWKSISRQSLPVTLKYPEMLAQIVPYFTKPELPRTGKETLWFL